MGDDVSVGVAVGIPLAVGISGVVAITSPFDKMLSSGFKKRGKENSLKLKHYCHTKSHYAYVLLFWKG